VVERLTSDFPGHAYEATAPSGHEKHEKMENAGKDDRPACPPPDLSFRAR
jgi:hypothetical protein